jgi:hypothetical protein
MELREKHGDERQYKSFNESPDRASGRRTQTIRKEPQQNQFQ